MPSGSGGRARLLPVLERKQMIIEKPRDDYHADYSAISSTMLKDSIEDLGLYHGRYISRELDPKKENKAMEIGSIIHAVALESKPLRSIVALYPDECLNKVGSVVAARAKAFRQANPEYRYFLKRREYQQVRDAINALRGHKYYDLIDLDEMVREKPIYFDCPITGLNCRCMPDFWIQRGNKAFVFDLKISTYALDFGKAINDFRYWVQQCHYTNGVLSLDGIDDVEYSFLAHTPEPPFHTTLTEIDPYSLFDCQHAYASAMRRLKTAIDENDWLHEREKEIYRHKVSRRSFSNLAS